MTTSVIYVSRKHPPSIGGMQKLSHHLLAEVRGRHDVVAIVWDCPRFLLGPFLGWVGIRLVWEFVRARNRNLVVHFGDPLVSLAAPLCTLWRVPTAVTIHGLDVTYPNWLYQRLLDAALPHVAVYISISTAARDACIRRGLPADRCVTITPGVESVPIIERRTARQQLGRVLGVELDDALLLLTIGRLIPRKGVAWFVAKVLQPIVERVPNVYYLVVGDGPERDSIESEARNVGLQERVILTGQVDAQTLARCLASADLFVMPNRPVAGDLEGFGLVALEAASAGLPVVAADLEGIRDAITDGHNGVLVPPDDVQAFAEAIGRFASDPATRQQFGARAARFSRARHSWTAMADAYIQVYERLARTGSNAVSEGRYQQ